MAGFQPVVSDLRPRSFSLSWTTAFSVQAHADLTLGGRITRIGDVRGNVSSTTHLLMIPCPYQSRRCATSLAPDTNYSVRIYSGAGSAVSLRIRTTPVLSPMAHLAAVGGQMVGSDGKPRREALVYVTVHHGGEASVPLAVLTLSNGKWLVALANAVAVSGKSFPLGVGDRIAIRVLTGHAHAARTVTLRSLDQPLLLKQPIVVR